VIDDYVDLCDPEDHIAVFEVSLGDKFPLVGWERLRQWKDSNSTLFSVSKLTDMIKFPPNCCRLVKINNSRELVYNYNSSIGYARSTFPQRKSLLIWRILLVP
jgi:hypothetical protein